MTNQAQANRLAALGKQEAQIMRQLARIQAERCKILCEGYTANAAALNLDPGVDPDVIQPKTEDGEP